MIWFHCDITVWDSPFWEHPFDPRRLDELCVHFVWFRILFWGWFQADFTTPSRFSRLTTDQCLDFFSLCWRIETLVSRSWKKIFSNLILTTFSNWLTDFSDIEKTVIPPQANDFIRSSVRCSLSPSLSVHSTDSSAFTANWPSSEEMLVAGHCDLWPRSNCVQSTPLTFWFRLLKLFTLKILFHLKLAIEEIRFLSFFINPTSGRGKRKRMCPPFSLTIASQHTHAESNLTMTKLLFWQISFSFFWCPRWPDASFRSFPAPGTDPSYTKLVFLFRS